MTELLEESFVSIPEAEGEEEKKEEFYFIAVADRGVSGTMGLFYHYSIQYWKTADRQTLRQEMDASALSSATKLKAIELLRNNNDWNVWEYKGLVKNKWKIVST